jgi:hypothetical protein
MKSPSVENILPGGFDDLPQTENVDMEGPPSLSVVPSENPITKDIPE